jgi:hypothetical protein
LGTQGVFGDLLRKISGEPIEPQGSHGGYAVAGGIFFKRSPGTPGSHGGYAVAEGIFFKRSPTTPRLRTVFYGHRGYLFSRNSRVATRTHPHPACARAARGRKGDKTPCTCYQLSCAFLSFPPPSFNEAQKVCVTLFFSSDGLTLLARISLFSVLA